MSETYEVNLLRNVHAVDSRSSVSKEFPGLRRKQPRDDRKRRGRYMAGNAVARVTGRESYVKDTIEDEQENTIDITV